MRKEDSDSDGALLIVTCIYISARSTKMTPLLEICIDTFESAVAAVRGGADRLELCAALSEGGLTPTIGLMREIKTFLDQNGYTTKLYAMIRCRRGSDFCYSETEMKIMLHDLCLLAENGADGFVFGALTDAGKIHEGHCRQICAEASARERPVTFHRAFDCTNSSKMRENLELVASLGFTTVLTSGYEPTALKGLDNIARLVEITNMKLGTRLTIMPGSGITPSNAREIIQKTGCTAIHASARSSRKNSIRSLSMGGSAADGEALLVCDESIVKHMKNQIN